MRLGIPMLIVSLLLGIMILGCPVAYLGDRYIYGIEGEIYGLGSMNGIPSVRVRLSCSKSKLSGSHETTSDNKGYFVLKGYGAPYDCELIFDHPAFKQKIIKLDQDSREEPKEGFGWVWKLKVELEKKE